MGGDDMLNKPVWAVVGDVLNQSKPAYNIVQKLRQHNKTVYLVKYVLITFCTMIIYIQ